MSDQNTSNQNESNAPTPASNQNLIIGIILGAVILLLCYLVMNFSNRGSGSASGLEQTRDDLRVRLNSERQRLGQPLLASSGQSAEALANRIDSDATSLTTILSKMTGDLHSAQSEVTGLRAAISSNSTTIQQLQQEKAQLHNTAAQAQSLAQQLEAQKGYVTNLQQQVTDLTQKLQGAPSPTALAELRQRLDAALRERDSYEEQLRILREKSGTMVSAGDLGDLQRKNNILVSDNEDLHYELQKLRAKLDKNLFVESDQLSPIAQKLYTKLSTLEGISNEDRLKRYVSINGELRASVIDSVKFQTGSSKMSISKIEKLRRTLENTRPDSFFLVVGYASKTGDSTANRNLSSKRAITIASQVNAAKKATQGIQAVFLGQTNRFSNTSPTENQLCEIWEIRK